MRTIIATTCALIYLSSGGWAFQPPANAPVRPDGFNDVLKKVKEARKPEESDRIAKLAEAVRDLGVIGVLSARGAQSVLSETERLRIDKQTSPGNAAGGTSLVERGTVPFLLGVAVENGAVTRTTAGTSITFTARPASLAKFLATNSFTGGAITSSSGLGAQLLNKSTLSVTYDITRGGSDQIFTGTKNQVSGFSAHIDLLNRRDPRDPKYARQWLDLTRTEGVMDAQASNHLRAFFTAADGADSELNAWVADTVSQLSLATDDQDDKGVDQVTQAAFDTLVMQILPRRLAADAKLREGADKSELAANRFAATRVELIHKILRSPTLALEYSVVRQTPPVGTDSTATTTAGAPLTALPDLGSLKFIASMGLGGMTNLTFNASLTTFDNTFRQDRIRDYRVGMQLDAPVMEIKNWGNVSFSLSGIYLKLRQQPLGETVKINGVVLNSIGNTGFAQAKIDVPFGAGGVRLPLAITWASRHELLTNQKNLFGANIGLTFDLDKLMASKSAK